MDRAPPPSSPPWAPGFVELDKESVKQLLRAGDAVVEPIPRERMPHLIRCEEGGGGGGPGEAGAWRSSMSEVWERFGAVRVTAARLACAGARCRDVVACRLCFQVYVYRSRRQGTSTLRLHRCPPPGHGHGDAPDRRAGAFAPVPQAPPATQKQSAPPQQPPPSQKMVPPQQVSAPKQIAPKPTSTPVSPLQPLPPPPEVCLRWNSYHSNMQATFPSLLNNEQFVDVTLACEGRSIKCHKMMLSACSAYFEELLSQNPCQHPIVLMKDLKYWEVQALVDFMYRGEVNVAQDKLPSLLAAAEALQIKGLAGPAFSSHDDENTQSSAPLSSAEDYLDESTPSPSGSRRARKRRVMSSTQSPRTQAVQSPQVPVTPTRSTTGKRTVKPSLSMPSTSNYQHESSNLPSEPPARRARKSESGELEIKIEPIDIEISNDSMDQMDDSFMEKTFDDAEAGDGGESSGQGDDPGGTNESKPSISSDTRMNVHGQDAEQMDFGNNSGTSRNDQNFRYEDSGSQDGMSAVPELPGTSYQESLSQPSSSGINSSDNLLGRM